VLGLASVLGLVTRAVKSVLDKTDTTAHSEAVREHR